MKNAKYTTVMLLTTVCSLALCDAGWCKQPVGEKVKENAHDAKEKIKDAAGDVADAWRAGADKAREKAHDIKEKVKEKARDTKEKIRNTKDEAANKAEETKEEAQVKTQQAKEKIRNKKDEAANKAEETKEEVQVRTQQKKETLSDRAEDLKNWTKEQLSEAEAKLKRASERAEAALKSALEKIKDDAQAVRDYLSNHCWKDIIHDDAVSGPVTLKNLTLNGYPKAVLAQPGETVEATVDCNLDREKCNSLSFYRIVVGLKGVGAQTTIGNELGIVAGPSKEKFSLVAPQEPGIYQIRYTVAETVFEKKARHSWVDKKGNEPSAATTIGVIVVQRPQS